VVFSSLASAATTAPFGRSGTGASEGASFAVEEEEVR
jgi:hypothetical protein